MAKTDRDRKNKLSGNIEANGGIIFCSVINIALSEQKRPF